MFYEAKGIPAGFVSAPQSLRGRQTQIHPDERKINPIFILFAVTTDGRILCFVLFHLGAFSAERPPFTSAKYVRERDRKTGRSGHVFAVLHEVFEGWWRRSFPSLGWAWNRQHLVTQSGDRRSMEGSGWFKCPGFLTQRG
jgi:hypothetical protein